MSSKSFGLDIGATTIKAVALQKTKGGFFLNSAITVPNPSKGVWSESLLDQEVVAGAIREAVSTAKITTKNVHVALPENQVYTRVIDLPAISDKELSSAIYWEAEQYIPVPLVNLQIAWEVLKRPLYPGENTKMQVLLVGAPKSLIEKYQKMLSMTQLQIVSLETEILSVVRALTTGEHFPNTLIVSIGSVSTSFAIIKDGTIVFTYSLPTGGTAINRAIASDFGFSLDQAEEYKKVYGMLHGTLGGKIGQATAPILSTIIDEVKKALAFYNEKYKNEAPIGQILLSGGSAKLPGITGFFVERTGLETVIANPWRIVAQDQMKKLSKEILDSASHYTISVGLGMKDI